MVREKHHRWSGCGQLSGDIWSNTRKNARVRRILFKITIAYAWALYERQGQRCALTNLPLAFTKTNKRWTTHTASLDRIDSAKGYVEGNVQWVHKDVNRMKRDFPQERFLEVCRSVAAHLACPVAPVRANTEA